MPKSLAASYQNARSRCPKWLFTFVRNTHLRQAEAGMPIKELGRKHGFSDASFYKWRSKYGGMDASEAKRLRELELENGKLKRLLAEAHLDIHALKSVFGTKR
jgi:putative transposase